MPISRDTETDDKGYTTTVEITNENGETIHTETFYTFFEGSTIVGNGDCYNIKADEPWIFDGYSGCEKCQAATGLYSSQPALPHRNCDCPITLCDYKTTISTPYGDFTEEHYTESTVEEVNTIDGDDVPYNETNKPKEYTLIATFSESEAYSESIAASALGITATLSETISESFSQTITRKAVLQPGQSGRLKIRVFIEIMADVYEYTYKGQTYISAKYKISLDHYHATVDIE